MSLKRSSTKSYTRRTGQKTKRGSQKQRETSQKSSGASDIGDIVRVEQLQRNVFRASIPCRLNADLEFWVLLTGDRHWDNPKSDRDMQLRHLDEALARNALIVDVGDFFCMMQGKFDKRSSKSAVRPEHQRDDYLDAIINDAAEFFSPYSKNFISIGVGNHEASIAKRHETQPTERLIGLLNSRGGKVRNGGFAGWVTFHFLSGEARGHVIRLHYDHGYGGGGPVTKDAIQHQRRAVIFPDADIVVSGHTHDAWVSEFARQRISVQGVLYQDIQTHIKVPTYKDDYGDGFGGWHVETGKPPKPLGAWWLKFGYNRKTNKIIYDVVRAR